MLHSLTEANKARQKIWDPSKLITPLFRGVELAGEVGEALNIVKKLEREKLLINGSRATVEELAKELADVVICVDLLAQEYGIDIGAAVVDKFNETSEKMNIPVKIDVDEK